jgi:hypothetical protein
VKDCSCTKTWVGVCTKCGSKHSPDDFDGSMFATCEGCDNLLKWSEVPCKVHVKELTWKPLAGGLDYITEGYFAEYKYTHRSGFACYWTFKIGTPKYKRTMRNAVHVGGLPSKLPS